MQEAVPGVEHLAAVAVAWTYEAEASMLHLPEVVAAAASTKLVAAQLLQKVAAVASPCL